MVFKYKKSSNIPDGRMNIGGSTDVFPTRLGWWDRLVFTKSDTDIRYVVTPKTEFRPDLISYDIYKKTSYTWLVLQYNNIVDVNEELQAGRVLKLPTQSRVIFEFSNNTL